MIRAVTVTNYLGESKKFELMRPEKSGFIVERIDGLGPSQANINITETATNDGALFNSSRVNARNIVLLLKFMFNPQVEDVRQETYKYLPIKQKVKLLIETDNRICETYGFVESNEPDIFSKSESTQISIICPDPYFYSAKSDTIVFYGVDPLFEFPFSSELMEESILDTTGDTIRDHSNDLITGMNEKKIEMGSIKNEMEQTIYYHGDAETGVIINIHAVDAVSNINIYNVKTREMMSIDTDKMEQLTGSGIMARDEIIISTVRGNKYIRLLRNGIYTNILNCLNKDADWFQLSKGDNIFAYTAEEGVTNLRFQIEYKRLYEGV